MVPSNEWIEFESRGKRYRAQLAETGLIIEALRYICTKQHNMFDPPTKKDWRPSEPPQWDQITPYFYRGSSEILNALKSALAIRGRYRYQRRRRANGKARSGESQLATWIAAHPSVSVAQGRILIAAAYGIIDCGAWFEQETIERLHWHKRELAAWKDPAALYVPWIDLKRWLWEAITSSRKPDRWKLWRDAAAGVEALE